MVRHGQTDTDLGKMFEQSLMFGVNASITNALFKGGSKADQDDARNAFLLQAQKYPVETLRAVDDAITLSYTDDHYDTKKLMQLKTDIAAMHLMQFPKNFSQEQKVATWAIKKQRDEWKADMVNVDEAARGMYEDKIKELDAKMREVAGSKQAAFDYMNELSEQVYNRLDKGGYFDTEDKQGRFALVRHGQTDANERGIIGSENDPINVTGRKQALEVAKDLKQQGYENVMTSPTMRTDQSARVIANETGGRLYSNPDLREWDRGTGADADFDYKYYIEHPDEKPQGGSESFNDFLARIQRVRNSRIADNTAIVTHGKVMKLWESLDKSGGMWDEKAKTEFLKDSNDFENTEVYSPQRTGDIARDKTIAEDKGQADKTTGNRERDESAIRAEKQKAIDKEAEESPESKKQFFEKRKQLVDKYGKDINEMIDDLEKEGRLKRECPPTAKRKFSLRNLIKR